MARRKRRFSRLNEMYRAARGEVENAAPELKNYGDFLKGVRKIKQTQVVSSADRRRYGVAIVPFNVYISGTPDATDRLIASITKYSNDGRKSTAVGLSDADLGYESIDESTGDNPAFYPALIRFFVKTSAGTAPGSKVSDITGTPYTRFAGKSFSVPFGRTSDTTQAEEEVRKSIVVKLRASASVTGISYEPELFRTSRPVLSNPPA